MVHKSYEHIDQIIEMQERLTVGNVTRKDMTDELSFINPLDLMRQGNRTTPVGIHARDSEQHDRRGSPLGENEVFGLDLGFRIGPCRFKRPLSLMR